MIVCVIASQQVVYSVMEAITDLLPQPPRKPFTALFLALAAFYLRELTFPLREKNLKGESLSSTCR
jgi:hypothetical protein